MSFAKIVLLLIFLSGFFLRTYRLDTNPPSTYGDEISFAWNAWNILHTGTDEHGVSYPLQFKAFDDYKAPIPVYILVPVFYFFGMNTLNLRMVVAVAGAFTVLATFFLTKALIDNFYQRQSSTAKEKIPSHLVRGIPYVSTVLMAISPWHMHLSRGYFEATIALMTFVWGTYFFIMGIRKPLFFYFSSILFNVTLYSYFSPRILLIFFIPFLVLYYLKDIRHKKHLVMAAVVFIVISLPLVKLAIFDNGANRFTWFMSQRLERAINEAKQEQIHTLASYNLNKILHNRYLFFLRYFMEDYLAHFTLDFWYIFGDNSLRYFLGKMGMFYLIELPFLIGGFWYLLRFQRKIVFFLIGWLLLAPIPAAFVGRPFAVRSLAMLPAPFIVVSFGIQYILLKIMKFSKMYGKIFLLFTIFSFIISLLNHQLRYYFDYPVYGARWWGWENKAAVDLSLKNKDSYDYVFISNYYSGAELAYAFYTGYDPLAYRKAHSERVVLADDKGFIKLGNVFFGSLHIDDKRLKENLIPPKSYYIGRPDEADGVSEIRAPEDGGIIYKIHITQ